MEIKLNTKKLEGVLNDLLLKEPDVLRHLAIPVDERKLKYQIKMEENNGAL